MNLPNKLSILRICFIPFVMFFYMQNFWVWGKLVAAILFALAAFTDMLDGYIARKYNMVTDLGKLLDTNADKILILAALLLVMVDGTIPAPYGVICGVIIVGRDMVISTLRQIAASKNFVMAADMIGKVKAFLTDIAMFMFIILAWIRVMAFNETFVLVFAIISYAVLTVSVILTIWSMIHYLVKNRAVLKQD